MMQRLPDLRVRGMPRIPPTARDGGTQRLFHGQTQQERRVTIERAGEVRHPVQRQAPVLIMVSLPGLTSSAAGAIPACLWRRLSRSPAGCMAENDGPRRHCAVRQAWLCMTWPCLPWRMDRPETG